MRLRTIFSKRLSGVTFIELLVTITILGVLVIPVLITYQNSRANQALRVSAERLANTLTNAHIYAREAKDQVAWGVKNEGSGKYSLIKGTPSSFDVVSSYSIESQIQFVDDFTIWFGFGTGDIPTEQVFVLENKNGKQTQVIVRETGVIEVTSI